MTKLSKIDTVYRDILEKDSEYLELVLNTNFYYFGKEEKGRTSPLVLQDAETGMGVIHIYENADDLKQYEQQVLDDMDLADDADVIETQGMDIFKVFGKEYSLIINPHSEYYRDFYPDQVENILSNIEEVEA